MSSGETTRRKLKFPKTTDTAKFCSDWEEFANQLDNDAETGQGTEAERPAAKTRGRLWMTQGDGTAAKNGLLWWDTGVTWIVPSITPAVGQSYPALVEQNSETEYEPSAIRSAFVLIVYNGKEIERVTVGGVIVSEMPNFNPVGIVVPPGTKYKVKVATGAKYKQSTLFL